MATPRISVIMLFFDNGNTEKRRFCKIAVDSILRQTLGDFEFLIIASGKRDFIAKMAKKSSKIRVFFRKERLRGRTYKDQRTGIVGARNLGIAKAIGEYVAFADADDISLPERLEVQCRYLDNHADIDMVGSVVRLIDKEDKYTGFGHVFENDIDIKKNILWHIPMRIATLMARKAALKEMEGFSLEERAEDYEFFVRAAKKLKAHNIQYALVKYRLSYGASTQYPLQSYLSGLRIKLKAIRTLGIIPMPFDIAMEIMSFASLLYPDFYRTRIMLKLKRMYAKLNKSYRVDAPRKRVE